MDLVGIQNRIFLRRGGGGAVIWIEEEMFKGFRTGVWREKIIFKVLELQTEVNFF